MLLKSFEFVLIAYGLTLLIALFVAGMIKAIYVVLDRRERRAQAAKSQIVDPRPQAIEPQVTEYKEF